MNEDITSALSFVEDARSILDEFDFMEPDHEVRKLQKHLCRAFQAFSSAWGHVQVGSLANAAVRYASIATVDVGVSAVHSGLRTLKAQALRVGTCARRQQADQLAK